MKIYILLTYTGTILSKIVRLYTRNDYCHVSISLDKELHELYSFGRLNPYNPFIGGFVHEGITFGTFKRFKNTRCELYELDVPLEKYNDLKNIINDFNLNKNKYSFNVVGLFSQAFHIKRTKENKYYCSEFCKYALEKSNIVNNLPDLIKPIHFKNIDNLNLIYSGLLRNYNETQC